MNYKHADDGKLHTRFSELTRCTPGQIERVVAERMGDEIPFQNEHMEFGIVRHDRLAKYCKKHCKVYPNFKLDLEIDPENAEKQIAVEMFENVVIHGTPDIFGQDWIADFKTIILDDEAEENKPYLEDLNNIPNARKYKSSRQTAFYAWLLKYYGHDIKKTYYLCEVWNKRRTKILGYLPPQEKEITEDMLNELVDWTKERIYLLATTLKNYQRIEV